MIISRRKIHLFSSIALAIMMPIIFIAGILFRPAYTTITADTDQLMSYSTGHTIVTQPWNQSAFGQDPISSLLKH